MLNETMRDKCPSMTEEEISQLKYKESCKIYISVIGHPTDYIFEDMPVWAGGDVFKIMEELFLEAQEKVCIRGKEELVYKSFDHWLTVKQLNINRKND